MIEFIEQDNSKAIDIYTKTGQNYLGQLYQEIDGFYVFEPSSTLTGCWNEYMLKVILYKLSELNAPIQKELEKFLRSRRPPEN